MSEQLILNDGTVLDGRILDNGDGSIIFVYLTGMCIDSGYALMKDPARTSRIRFLSYGVEHVYVGYTKITHIDDEFGNCNLTMRKVVSA